MAEMIQLDGQLNQLTEIIKRLTEFRLTYDEYMKYVQIIRDSQYSQEEMEKNIDPVVVKQLQETLHALQLYLIDNQIMDEDANLLVDPQDLFD